MISAADAKKVTLEAQEALKKKQTLEEARRLEKLFQARMKESDQAVQAAMKRGLDRISFMWDREDFPEALRERYEATVRSLNYSCIVHVNDDANGYEVVLIWGDA